MTKSKKYWFEKRRLVIWWTPCSWQGWLMMVASVGTIVFAAYLLAPKNDTMGDWHNLAAFFMIVVLDLLVLSLVSVQKGKSLS
jgi:hypothetical protein